MESTAREMSQGNQLYPVWGKNDYPSDNRIQTLEKQFSEVFFYPHRGRNLEIPGFFIHKT